MSCNIVVDAVSVSLWRCDADKESVVLFDVMTEEMGTLVLVTVSLESGFFHKKNAMAAIANTAVVENTTSFLLDVFLRSPAKLSPAMRLWEADSGGDCG